MPWSGGLDGTWPDSLSLSLLVISGLLFISQLEATGPDYMGCFCVLGSYIPPQGWLHFRAGSSVLTQHCCGLLGGCPIPTPQLAAFQHQRGGERHPTHWAVRLFCVTSHPRISHISKPYSIPS